MSVFPSNKKKKYRAMGRFSKLVGTRGQRGKRNARKKCKDSDQQGNKNANSKDGSRGPAGRTVHAAVACSKSIQKKGGEKKKVAEQVGIMLHRGSITRNN